MPTKTMMSVEEYLRTAFPDADREYVDGAVVEKAMPPCDHAQLQGRLIEIFYEIRKTRPLHAVPELRQRVSEQRFRIPDVAVFAGEKPHEQVPSSPPYATIEILSPDDRMTAILEKLGEYRAWGVPHIWLVDPEAKTCYEFGSDGLREVGSFCMPEYQLEITSGELFSTL